jgi:Acetyltransferase (GNAT) domain
MQDNAALEFRIASQAWEFEQIHRLNYATFVEEIPQHHAHPDRFLVDKFHQQNTYITCWRGARLVGMIAARGERPFSLDGKLENLDSYLPPGRLCCELRLLAVAPSYRHGRVFRGLGMLLLAYCERQGYDLVIISGTTRQQRLYVHLGFIPFGPLVGTPQALFQPMYLTLERFEVSVRGFRPVSESGARRRRDTGAGRDDESASGCQRAIR